MTLEQSGSDNPAMQTLRHAFQIWVEPEIAARKQAGRLAEGFVLKAFQVLLPGGLDDRENSVRLNEEVQIVARVRAKRSVAAGEIVVVGVEDLAEDGPTLSLPADEPNAAHFSALNFGKTWVYAFAFDYDKRAKEDARQLISAAEEFAAVAGAAVRDRHYRGAVENMFAATELAAKALLMLELPTQKGRDSHKWIIKNFTSSRHRDLLTELSSVREKARYLKGDFDPDSYGSEILLQRLTEFLKEANDIIALNSNSLPVPQHPLISSRKFADVPKP